MPRCAASRFDRSQETSFAYGSLLPILKTLFGASPVKFSAHEAADWRGT
jgi:hypothetical protein